MTRILHAPADVGGHAFGLSRGERELGLHSDVAVFSPGPFGYGTDTDLRAGVEHALPVRIARRAAFLRWALDRYDVFHFNFGQTLLTLRQFGLAFDELPLLRRRGKKVIVTYQGCDVRPFEACACRKPHCVAETPARQPRAARLTAFADRVLYLNPDLRRWLPTGTFVPYANVDPKDFAPEALPAGDEIVVAHAPTDRDVKGTRHLVDAIEALRAEGSPVRLDLIEGLTRAAAVDYGPHGIRTNAVALGSITTARSDQLLAARCANGGSLCGTDGQAAVAQPQPHGDEF